MRLSFFLVVLGYFTTAFCYAQNSKYNFSLDKLDKGEKYCDNLNFSEVQNPDTFIYCRLVYSFKFRYRNAFNVISKAHRIFPYDYNVRLHKALALQELGSYKDATKELIGLINIYPQKAELHNYLGRIQYKHDKTKALMPFLINVSLSPNDKNSKENLIFIRRLFLKKSSRRDDSEPSIILGTTGKNNFDWVNHRLEDLNTKTQLDNQHEWFVEKINQLSTALENSPRNRSGFFWDYYAKYFIELQEKDLIEDFVSNILNNSDLHKYKDLVKHNAAFGLQ